MPMLRSIASISHPQSVVDGAGVHIKRMFGFGKENLFDPFLLLDNFGGDKPEEYLAGFPWHPHRGIETITYMLEGDVEHGDSIGNQGWIHPGDVQWMTAGSGIIHQEMPKGNAEGRMSGFQLWANLPSSEKMMEPRYRDIRSQDIPIVEIPQGMIRIICGSVGNTVRSSSGHCHLTRIPGCYPPPQSTVVASHNTRSYSFRPAVPGRSQVFRRN